MHRPQQPEPFLRRVRLRNWKSIAACDVALAPLTFLVGPNGSGKSHFVDGLRFVVGPYGGSANSQSAAPRSTSAC